MINQDLLDMLCCPETKADLILDDNRLVSTDPETRLVYSIKNDIPVMLVEEAKTMEKSEWEELMKKHGRIK